MATAIYKNVELPLLPNLNTPPTSEADPYRFVFYGVYDDGSGLKDYVYREGLSGLDWYVSSVDDQLINIPRFANKKQVFPSKIDEFGNISDLNILGKRVLKIEFPTNFYLEGEGNYIKELNSDTVTVLPGSSLPSSGNNCTITTN